MTRQSESPATALKRLRAIDEKRRQHALLMNKARWKNPEMCPCGCGLTLGRAMRNHPARIRELSECPF